LYCVIIYYFYSQNGKIKESSQPRGSLAKNAPFECQLKAIEDAEGNPKFKVDFYQNGAIVSVPPIESPLPHWAVEYLNVKIKTLIIFNFIIKRLTKKMPNT
jgi:hypothetical protein